MSLSVRDLTSYALHLGKAKGRYKIHSPFVYELLVNCIQDRRHRPAYEPIEECVNALKKDGSTIEVKDLGAGSKWASSSRRKVKEIAVRSGASERYGRLLYRLAERFAPRTAIELGSSLGIGTLYLAAGAKGSIHSIEGCPASARIADQNLRKCSFKNAQVLTGSFEELLPELLEKTPSLDLIRIDGDHQGEALLNYFERG